MNGLFTEKVLPREDRLIRLLSMPSPALFSKDTLAFISKASKQKNPEWLDKNRDAFESLVRRPLQHLAATLAHELKSEAPGYHFPLKGLGRLKRSTVRAEEYGSFYKSAVAFTITRPAKYRFDHNPSLFFMIDSKDLEGDEMILAGGLYMPNSRQLRAIREKIAENPKPFEALFKTKAFATQFPHGFSDERISTRVPRGFDAGHTHLHWLKLQGFFVWKSFTKKEYCSANFAEKVVGAGRQVLRLNELLDQAVSGHWNEPKKSKTRAPVGRLLMNADEMAEGKVALPTPDF